MSATEDVKIKVSADASQARAEMGKLARGVDDVGGKFSGLSKSFSSGLGSIAKGLGTFNLAFGGVVAGIGAIKSGLNFVKESAELNRLEKALPVGAFSRLEKATSGAIGRAEGLKLATRALSGDLKITSAQFDSVAKAAEAAERRGFGPAAENLDRMLDAFQKGNVQKLDDFGIAVEKTGNRMTDLANATAAFDRYASDTGPLDERTATIRKFEQALDKLGVVVRDIALAVFDFGASVIGVLKDIETGMDEAWAGAGDMAAQMEGYKNLGFDVLGGGLIDPMRRREAFLGKLSDANAPGGATGSGVAFGSLAAAGSAGAGGAAGARGGRGRGGGSYSPNAYEAGDREVSYDETEYMENGLHGRRGVERTWSPFERPQEPNGRPTSSFDRQLAGAGYQDPLIGRLGSMLEGSADGAPGGLGASYNADSPMGSFLDMTAEKSKIAGEALGAFGNAATTAFAAALSGSESFGSAMKKASASALMSLSVEWGVRALGELAWGVSSLANPLTAATAPGHFAAAAKWGAAAAAAGAGAAALGSGGGGGRGGGGGGGAGPAGGGFARPSGGQGGGGGDTIVINLGDGFIGNRQEVAEAIAGGVRDAKRRGARENFTTSFKG